MNVKLITRATSLGATESLIEHRHSIETLGVYPNMSAPMSPPNLLRFSVGLEDPDDIIRDLASAIDSLPK